MNISIIGAGNIGSILGEKWVEAKHVVTFGVRHPNASKYIGLANLGKVTTIPEAIASAEVILLSLPGAAVTEFAAQYGASLSGKIVLDSTNNPGASVMNNIEALQQHAPHAYLVRAFSTLGGENFYG
jgi:predicted dinucleotide-binding enzyme